MTVALNTLVLAADRFDTVGATPGWYLESIGDWDTVPDSKTEIREYPQSDGAHSLDSDNYKSLPFSIKGNYLGSSRADVQAAKTLLKGSIARGVMIPVVVTEVDGPRRRMASVRHISFPNDRHDAKELAFTVDLIATDPKMYGAPQVSTAAVQAVASTGLTWPLGTAASGRFWDWGADNPSTTAAFTNYGNVPTFVDLIAYGGMSGGFSAFNKTLGRTIRLDRLIPAGSKAVVVQRTERAYVDTPTNDISGQLTRMEFFSIGPGETHLIQFVPLGTLSGVPSFAVSGASAYI